MNPVPIMINGLPGNVSRVVLGSALADARVQVVPYSLTGPEIADQCHEQAGFAVRLLRPADREAAIGGLLADHANLIALDFTHPSAVNANAEFYCRHKIPFVMGTTGGDRARLAQTVQTASIPAVIAPNMAKQIVGFQAMLEYAAETFPALFTGYRLVVRESHQQGKADTSGTARAVVRAFNRLGVVFDADQIQKERDPQVQQGVWGVPAEYLSGHGWHTYTLDSADGTVRFEFTHNVNGRDIYISGALDAAVFLAAKAAAGARGRVFSMIDVLKGNREE